MQGSRCVNNTQTPLEPDTELGGETHRSYFTIDRAAFNQGMNALYEPQIVEGGVAPTLAARGPCAVAYERCERH